jgi:hypothetical protein
VWATPMPRVVNTLRPHLAWHLPHLSASMTMDTGSHLPVGSSPEQFMTNRFTRRCISPAARSRRMRVIRAALVRSVAPLKVCQGRIWRVPEVHAVVRAQAMVWDCKNAWPAYWGRLGTPLTSEPYPRFGDMFRHRKSDRFHQRHRPAVMTKAPLIKPCGHWSGSELPVR